MFTISLDSSVVSHFLAAILEWFDDNSLQYCVQRNYQGYPNRLTGDVDLVVLPGQVVSIAHGIRQLAKRVGWDCYVEHAWKNAAHLGFYKPVCPGRFALVVELFAGGGWRGMTYLLASRVLERRIRHGITWRPSPAHQAIITVIHHLLYNGHVPLKYRTEVASLVNEDSESFVHELSYAFGHRLAELTLESIVAGDWDTLANKVQRYKLVLIVRSSLRSPLAFAAAMLQGFVASRHVPAGVVLAVCSANERQRHDLCGALLTVANRWHLFLPPVRKMIDFGSLNPVQVARNRRLIQYVVRRGGVAIVGCDDTSVIVDADLCCCPYVFRCTVDECRGSRQSVDPVTGSLVLVPSTDDVDSMAYRIWDYVLRDRARVMLGDGQ